MKRILISLCFGFITALAILAPTPAVVQAQNCNLIIPDLGCQVQQVRQEGTATNGESRLNTTLNSVWGKLIRLVYLGLGIAGVLLIIYEGIRYMTGAGNPDVVKKARQNLVNVIVGVLLLGSSYVIVSLILRVMYSAGK